MAKEVLQQLEVYKQCAQSLGRPRVSLAGFEKIRRRHHRLLVCTTALYRAGVLSAAYAQRRS